MRIESSGPVSGLVSLQLSEFNLILFSLCHALTLEFFWECPPESTELKECRDQTLSVEMPWGIYWREPSLEQTIQVERSLLSMNEL